MCLTGSIEVLRTIHCKWMVKEPECRGRGWVRGRMKKTFDWQVSSFTSIITQGPACSRNHQSLPLAGHIQSQSPAAANGKASQGQNSLVKFDWWSIVWSLFRIKRYVAILWVYIRYKEISFSECQQCLKKKKNPLRPLSHIISIGVPMFLVFRWNL